MRSYMDRDEDDGVYGTCDICGAPLAPEDSGMHICKVCQGMQEDE